MKTNLQKEYVLCTKLDVSMNGTVNNAKLPACNKFPTHTRPLRSVKAAAEEPSRTPGEESESKPKAKPKAKGKSKSKAKK